MGEWGPVAATAVINLVVAVYVYGRLTERVNAHTDDINELRTEHKEHGSLLYDHGQRISHLEGKRHGA